MCASTSPPAAPLLSAAPLFSADPGCSPSRRSAPAHRCRTPTCPPSLGTSDRWIRNRTGIEARGIAGNDESVIDLATIAGAKALASAGVDAAEIDLLLLASCSLPSQIPGAAPAVASRLGLAGGALDVNAACAGFCYALGLGADAVRSGTARNVLVIGAEKMTDWLDWTDRGTAILFGDGAGAAVLGATDPATDGDADGVGPIVWGWTARPAT